MKSILVHLTVVSALIIVVSGALKKYHDPCTKTEECNVEFLCLKSLCTCPPKTAISSDKRLCRPGAKLGEKCQETGQCLVGLPDTYCDINGTCACAPGWGYNNADSTCSTIVDSAVAYGGRCVVDSQCKSGMFCEGETCECTDGLTYDRASKKCIPIVVTRAPGTCVTNDHCLQYPNMECRYGICYCKTGYELSTMGHSCIQVTTPATTPPPTRNTGVCHSNSDCYQYPNTRCTNGMCNCKPRYRLTGSPQNGFICSAGAGLQTVVVLTLLSLLLSKVVA